MKTLLSAVISSRPPEPHPLPHSRSQPSESLAHQPLSRSPFGRRSTDAVECPRCGKRSIVARAHNVFDCLNCSFHRELPPVAKQRSRQQTSALSTVQSVATRSLLSSPRHVSPLMSSEAYRSPLELADELDEEETSQPWLFAAIAVIFGILLL